MYFFYPGIPHYPFIPHSGVIPSYGENIIQNPFYQNHNYRGYPSLPIHPQPTIEVPYHIEREQPQKLRSQEQVVKKNDQFPTNKELKKLPFVDKHNIVPNNINHILAFIQRKSKSQVVINKIIERENKNGLDYSSKRYYSYQSFIKNKLSIHVNIKALMTVLEHIEPNFSVFSHDEQIFYNKVTRIAIRYYLRSVAPLVTLNSKRLKNTSRQDHFRSQRFLLSCVKKCCGNRSNCTDQFFEYQ